MRGRQGRSFHFFFNAAAVEFGEKTLCQNGTGCQFDGGTVGQFDSGTGGQFDSGTGDPANC